MTAPGLPSEVVAFEAWYRTFQDGDFAPGSGNYNDNRGIALAAWTAARRAAVEEGAKALHRACQAHAALLRALLCAPAAGRPGGA